MSLCECGCGSDAPIAKRFVHGHNNRVASPETRAKIGAASALRERSPETRAKAAASLRGRTRTDQQRANIAEGRRNGKTPYVSPEALARRNAAITGPRHPLWKGGRQTTVSGYALVYVGRGEPMADAKGYVFEHRLVMAKVVGRPLSPEEVVHHINRDPGDNRPENLRLFSSNAEHMRHHGELDHLGHRRATSRA